MNKFRNNYLNFDISLIQLETSIFGQKVSLDQFKVDDTSTFWQTDKVYNSKEEALDYIGCLLNCRTKSELNFYRWCAKYRLREGTIIEFEDGKQGLILGKDYTDNCLKYSPIKKDGTVSKLKRNLYGNLKYEIIKY